MTARAAELAFFIDEFMAALRAETPMFAGNVSRRCRARFVFVSAVFGTIHPAKKYLFKKIFPKKSITRDRLFVSYAPTMTFMKPDESNKSIPQSVRELLLVEIFSAYGEVGYLLKKSKSPETIQTLLDMKRGLDMALSHLSPLGAQSEQHWKQLRAQL